MESSKETHYAAFGDRSLGFDHLSPTLNATCRLPSTASRSPSTPPIVSVRRHLSLAFDILSLAFDPLSLAFDPLSLAFDPLSLAFDDELGQLVEVVAGSPVDDVDGIECLDGAIGFGACAIVGFVG